MTDFGGSDNQSGWSRFNDYLSGVGHGIGDLLRGSAVEPYVEPVYTHRLYGQCLGDACTRRTWVAEDQALIALPTHLRNCGWREIAGGWVCPNHRKEWGL